MRKILTYIILLCLILTPFSLRAETKQSARFNSFYYFEKVPMGTIKENVSVLHIGEEKIRLYSCLGTLFIPLKSLEEHTKTLDLEGKLAYMNPQPLYIGNLQTYSLVVGNETLIPIEALSIVWDIEKEGWYYNAYTKKENFNQYITMTAEKIYNHSPYMISLIYKELYYNGKEIVEIEHKKQLMEQGEVLSRKIEEDKGIYLTSFCTMMNEWHVEDSEEDYGQKNNAVLDRYTESITLIRLEKLFKPYIVMGKMNYLVGDFEIGEKVEVWRGEKRRYYTVINKEGKKVNIPWGSIDIPMDSWVNFPEASKDQIETYARLKDFKSDTDYFVWTDLYRQRTYILKQENGGWQLKKTMVCSSGSNKYLTPRGSYKLYYRMPYFGVEKGFRCKNAVVIFRDYMYHSILFDKTGHYPKEGLYELGQRRSHGCIRLLEEDSAWLYENVPLESTVWIN